MRVALVSESFAPTVNGVTNSVVRAVEHLRRTGHEAVVVAPGPGQDSYGGTPVVRTRSFSLPGYREFPLGVPAEPLERTLREIAPDVVHLASPVVLGWYGARAAHALGIPAVAVFQTDLAGFARRYHLRAGAGVLWGHLRRLHSLTALTLAPSTATAWLLRRHGIGPVVRWGRGVDLARFSPEHRSVSLRRTLAPNGEVVVGYAGRLAREKRVHLLRSVADLPGVRVVVVGDGPARRALSRRLPDATFLGFLHGPALAQTVASFDVFVHTGREETFCQAIQEALASGVPVVAPASGGPLDLVRHGDNGYLWADDDPAVLRQTVASLVDDQVLRETMRLRARASVLGRTWYSVGDELIGHYETVLGGRTVLPAGKVVDRPVDPAGKVA